MDRFVSDFRDWIYGAPDKKTIAVRKEIIERFGPFFKEFAECLDKTNFTTESKQQIIHFADQANQYADYKLSIKDFLSKVEDPNVISDIDVRNTGYLMLLMEFNNYTRSKYDEVFPEFRIDKPGSAIHLQTLSQFISLALRY